MNALQIFQQNFNIRPEPVPAEDVDDGKTAESEVQKIPVPEIPAPVPETPVPEPEPEIPEPEPEILEPEPEIPEPEPKISVVTTIKLNNTVVPEVANTINEIRRVQRRSSKLAIFRFWSASKRSKVPDYTIEPVLVPTPVPVLTPVPVPVPVPVPSTVKPVVPETSYIDGLRIISLLPATYDLQPLRLRLLLQTPRNLHEKSFIIEVDPAAPLWVFDVNLRLLDLPDWPADLHFTHLKITEMLRKSHMKRLYCNLNGLTPRQIMLRNYDSLTFY